MLSPHHPPLHPQPPPPSPPLPPTPAGSSKSTIASEAACKLNPRLHINPLQNRVSPETEGVFNDAFWEGLDLVVNALDNVNARLYWTAGARRVCLCACLCAWN